MNEWKDPLLDRLGEMARDERVAQAAMGEDELWLELNRPLDLSEMAPMVAHVAELQRPVRSPVWKRRVVQTAAVLMPLAAALTLVWQLREPDLPLYSLSVTGGEAAQRGVTETAQRTATLRQDGQLDILLRPSESTQARVSLTTFVSCNGSWSRIDIPHAASEEGAIRILLNRASLGEHLKGQCAFHFFVGEKAHLPESESSAKGCVESDCEGVRSLELKAVLAEN